MIVVFSKEWFKKYNKQLCWLANSFIGDFIFKISKMGHDKKKYGKITEMHPNAITHKQRLLYNFEKKKIEQEYTTQFFSRNEYALRLQKVFYPIWLLFHGWDMLIANKFKPAWNLGFDTLTVYPGSIGANNPVDGNVYRYEINETLSTIRAGAGSGYNIVGSLMDIKLRGSTTTDQFERLYRSLVFFDTSALPDTATISDTTLSLYCNAKSNGLGSPDLHIAQGNAASTSTLAASDYAQANHGTTSFGSVSYADLSLVAYSDITLNASGIAAISKTGISKFSLQLDWDINNNFTGSWDSNVTSNFSIYTAENTGSDKDPKLVVTYTTVTTYTKTIQAKARVQQSDIAKTVQAKGRVKQVGIDKTVQAKADIKQKDIAGTVQAKANITKAEEKTIQAKAKLKQLDIVKTIQSKARIKDTDIVKTIQAKARVQQTPVKTIQAKANILGAGLKNIQVKSRIKQTESKTIQSKARLKGTLAKTIQSKTDVKNTVIVGAVTNSEGPKSPGTIVSVAESPYGGSYAWANPNNAKVSDNNYATVAVNNIGDVTESLKATNFGFSIPVVATIVGIKAEFECKYTGSSAPSNFLANIVKGGVIKADKIIRPAITTTEGYRNAGDSTELWEQTWTPADINAANFGVSIGDYYTSPADLSYFVDHIRITVYYTTGEGLQAKANITKALSKTIQAKARLKTTPIKTIQSKAAIKQFGIDQTIQGKAKIAKALSKTIQTKARLKQLGVEKTIQSKTDIKQSDVSQTIQAKARLLHTEANTIQAKARLETTPIKTIQSKAAVKQFGVAQSIQGKARIGEELMETVQAKADIKQLGVDKTVQSKADIKQSDIAKTIQSKARLKQLDIDKTVQAKVRIKDTDIDKTIQVKARLKSTEIKTIQSKAGIKQTGVDKTIQAKAQIEAPVVKTIKAKADIKKIGVAQTVQAKANILGIAIKTITAKANLWAFRSGYVKMKSRDQSYPITLNSDKDFSKLRSVDQEYPITLKDNRIL